MRQHIDVVNLHDESGLGISLLLRHDLGKFRIRAPRLEPLVAFLFGRIPADVDERVLGADPELRVALLWNPVPDVRDTVPRVDGRGPAREPRGQRVPPPWQGGVDPQLVEPGRRLLLRVAPADASNATREPDKGGDLPFQHIPLFDPSLDLVS